MTIKEAAMRSDALVERLLDVWEASVRATHDFLTESDICAIKAYVPQAICGVAHLLVVEDEGHQPVGFMGICGDVLEMLFLAPDACGQGIGKALLTVGIEKYGVRTLTVNEQNPHALGFYRHMGFEVTKRTETDEQGQPFPLLYMTLAK